LEQIIFIYKIFIWQKEEPGWGRRKNHAPIKPPSGLKSSGLCSRKRLTKKSVNKVYSKFLNNLLFGGLFCLPGNGFLFFIQNLPKYGNCPGFARSGGAMTVDANYAVSLIIEYVHKK